MVRSYVFNLPTQLKVEICNTFVIPNMTCSLCFPTIDDHASSNSWKLIYSCTSKALSPFYLNIATFHVKMLMCKSYPHEESETHLFDVFMCLFFISYTQWWIKISIYVISKLHTFNLFFLAISGHASPSSCKLIRSLFSFATL